MDTFASVKTINPIFVVKEKGDEISKNLTFHICTGNPTTNFLLIYLQRFIPQSNMILGSQTTKSFLLIYLLRFILVPNMTQCIIKMIE
jgi:hypothetical protein